MRKTVIVYSAQCCCDCQELHKFLKHHKIPCEIRDIQKNPSFRKDLMENVGEIAVPFAVLDGKWIRGYPDGQGFSEEYAKIFLEFCRDTQFGCLYIFDDSRIAPTKIGFWILREIPLQ